MKTLLFKCLLSMTVTMLIFAYPSSAAVSWTKTYYGSYATFRVLCEGDDGGYVAFGVKYNPPNRPNNFIVSIDGMGDIKWQKIIGHKNNYSMPNTAVKTLDGAYLVAGEETGTGGSGWIMKIDAASGNILWQKNYFISYYSNIKQIEPMSDGTFAVYATHHFPIGWSSGSIPWLFKIDTDGNIVWQKLIGAQTFGIAVTDKDEIVVAQKASEYGADILVLKFSTTGNLVWQRGFDDPTADIVSLEGVVVAQDGNYVIYGETRKYYNDVTHSHPWILKLDDSGSIVWQKVINDVWFRDNHSWITNSGSKKFGPDSLLIWDMTHGGSLKIDGSGKANVVSGLDRLTDGIVDTQDGGVLTASTMTHPQGNAGFMLRKRSQPSAGGCSPWRFAQQYEGQEYVLIPVQKSSFITPKETGAVATQNDFTEMPASFIVAEQCISAIPEIYVGSESIAYGFSSEEVGQSLSESIMIANNGGDDLVVNEVIITGENADQFSLASNCSTLIPGNSCSMDVTFGPTLLGEKNATLKIVSNDPSRPVIEIPLSGKGIDTRPPVVSIATDIDMLWPPNHKMVAVLVNGTAVDDGSGIASVDITIADEYETYSSTLSGFGNGVALEAWRDGADKDGRVYTLTAVATDNAGNTSTATTQVLVPHDMR